MRGLEERLGLRLLARTTRSVAPTEAGERLMRAIGPHLESVADALAAISRLRETPAGAVRISASEHAANSVLYPAVARLARDYPEIAIEVCVDNAFVDIVGAALRRRRAARRAGRQRHGRRAHRPRHAHGDRRRARLFRALPAAADARAI